MTGAPPRQACLSPDLRAAELLCTCAVRAPWPQARASALPSSAMSWTSSTRPPARRPNNAWSGWMVRRHRRPAPRRPGEISLLVAVGRSDDAIRLLTVRPLRRVGGRHARVADDWTAAHLLRGRQRMAAGRHREAFADFRAARPSPPTSPPSGSAPAAARRRSPTKSARPRRPWAAPGRPPILGRRRRRSHAG